MGGREGGREGKMVFSYCELNTYDKCVVVKGTMIML